MSPYGFFNSPNIVKVPQNQLRKVWLLSLYVSFALSVHVSEFIKVGTDLKDLHRFSHSFSPCKQIHWSHPFYTNWWTLQKHFWHERLWCEELYLSRMDTSKHILQSLAWQESVGCRQSEGTSLSVACLFSAFSLVQDCGKWLGTGTGLTIQMQIMGALLVTNLVSIAVYSSSAVCCYLCCFYSWQENYRAANTTLCQPEN